MNLAARQQCDGIERSGRPLVPHVMILLDLPSFQSDSGTSGMAARGLTYFYSIKYFRPVPAATGIVFSLAKSLNNCAYDNMGFLDLHFGYPALQPSRSQRRVDLQHREHELEICIWDCILPVLWSSYSRFLVGDFRSQVRVPHASQQGNGFS